VFKDSILNKIKKYVITHYHKLDQREFELGEMNYNHRCHLNAVQKIREHKAEKIYSCIAIDKDNDWFCVHFINKTKDDKYVDHTWGWMYEQYDYYLIREIDKEEQNRIGNILMMTKEMLVDLHSNWFQRLFVKSDIV
jgi:hypothetical protein